MHIINHPPQLPKLCFQPPNSTTIMIQILCIKDHKLCQNNGVSVRMDGVDPIFPDQIQIVRSREQPNQTVLIFLPNPERKLHRLRVHLNVIIAYQDATCPDPTAGEKSRIQATRSLREHPNRCACGVEEREISRKFS
uniref:Uncharacterized protein n=1 Tax=Opuntia streptacantha TaxID=393608 RepID=A0A7C9CXD8_OPUST